MKDCKTSVGSQPVHPPQPSWSQDGPSAGPLLVEQLRGVCARASCAELGLRRRPAVARIVREVADYFGHDPEYWREGRPVDDASRALAAYLARRRFGYSAREVATAVRYRGHGGVAGAVSRIESAGPDIRRIAEELAGKLN